MAPNVAPDVAPLFARGRTSGLTQASKKRSNPLVLVAMVVILLLIGSGMLRNLTAPQKVAHKVKVVGAAADILPGTKLNFHSLHYVEVPQAYVTQDLMEKSSQAVGRISKVFIAKGEPISTDELLSPRQTLAGAVETHERAITLKLDEDALVDHNLYPGDQVDVIVTSTRGSKKYTKTICQQVRVLMCVSRDALGSTQLRNDDRNKVTLAVLPEQAEMLAQAQETGKVRLVLRNKLSAQFPKLTGASEEDLLPESAFLEDLGKKASAALPFLSVPPPPSIPEVPSFMPDARSDAPTAMPQASAKPSDPIKWVVEVFSGSKKEIHEIGP